MNGVQFHGGHGIMGAAFLVYNDRSDGRPSLASDGTKRSELLGLLSAMTDGWADGRVAWVWSGMTFRRQAWHERTRLGLVQPLGTSLLGNSSSSSSLAWFGSVRFNAGGQSTWDIIHPSSCLSVREDRGAQLLCFPFASRLHAAVSHLICFCALWTYRRGYHGLVWSGLVRYGLSGLSAAWCVCFFFRDRERGRNGAAGHGENGQATAARRQRWREVKRQASKRKERCHECACVLCYRTVPSYPCPYP